MSRRRRFLAPLYRRGFTRLLQRKLQLPGHLRPFAFETHERFALLFVRSFAALAATTTSADFSLRFRVALSGTRRHLPR